MSHPKQAAASERSVFGAVAAAVRAAGTTKSAVGALAWMLTRHYCWLDKYTGKPWCINYPAAMSHSLGFGVKSMGKKAVPIEGVGAAKCDFVGMDAPRPSRKELSGVDELPKSGNMSADMDAALRKLENRRAAAAIHQHQPQAPHSKPEQNQRQYVRFLCIYSLH